MEERFLVVLKLVLLLLLVDLSVNGAQQQDSQCENEGDGVYLPCTFTSRQAGILKCRYTKNNTFPQGNPPHFTRSPGPPPELNVIPYPEDSGSRLNITWRLPCDASTQFLQGFLLTVTFVDDKQIPRTILRSFHVQVEMVEELKEVLMYYECLVPFANTAYHFEVLSQPSKDSKRPTNFITTDFPQNVESEYSYDWVAYMWANTNPDASSITACFYTAPSRFKFDQYRLSLQNKKDSENLLQPVTETITVDVDSQADANTKICRVFAGIVPDSYRIVLEPVALILSDIQSCTCRQGPVGEDNCVDSCTASVLGPISLPAPDPSPWPTYSPPSDHGYRCFIAISSSGTKLSPPPLVEVGKVVGIVVGAAVGAAVMFVLIFVVVKKYLKPPKPPIDPPDLSNKLLLVYFHDNDRHGSVVSRLAEYLKTVCRCDLVTFPSPVPSGASDSLHKYDLQTINKIRTTIIVHSTELFNYKKETPDGEIPLLAIQQLEKCENAFQYYHVLMPNTPEEFQLNGRGRTFTMLGELNELVAILGGEKMNAISDRLEEPGRMEYTQLRREFQIERSFFDNNNGQKMISVDSGYDTISNKQSDDGEDESSYQMYGQLFISPFPRYDINFIPPRTPSPTCSQNTLDLEEQLGKINDECGLDDSFCVYFNPVPPTTPSESPPPYDTIIVCDISKITF